MDFNFEDLPEILTFCDVKMILLISKPTLLKLLQSGEIPSFRVGKQYRILKTDLLQWMRLVT